MNFTVDSGRLGHELRLLNKVVPSKPAIAALGYIKAAAEGDVLRLFATDLDVGLSLRVTGVQSMVDGSTLLPAAKLLALVEQFPDDGVAFKVDGDTVTVACGGFKSKLKVLSVKDFPTEPEVEGSSCHLDAGQFVTALRRVRYAVTTTSQKQILGGALLKMQDAVALTVATDGKRLSMAAYQRAPGPSLSVVIPYKAIDWLSSNATAGDLELTVGDRHAAFECGERVLTARLMVGEFPAYERIIPKSNKVEVTADRAVLRAALKRVSLISDDNSAIYVRVMPGKVGLSSAAAGVGSAEEVVTASYDGPELLVCVNGGYVLDFLDAADSPEVTLAFKDAKGAVLISDGASHVGVVMLMRV